MSEVPNSDDGGESAYHPGSGTLLGIYNEYHFMYLMAYWMLWEAIISLYRKGRGIARGKLKIGPPRWYYFSPNTLTLHSL